ncbi:MAG: hypothetical protein JW779_14410, partial [Candidatus Thorarchaeota archaeon]|nr:hypothetical protein [Candidatus Thorarchaeota archaeon]
MQQRTVLLDALQQNLEGFRFKIMNEFSGIQLREQEKGAAAIISGVPLSIETGSQRKDSLDVVMGVLQELDDGIFQIFIEPSTMSKSRLKGLEEQYKSEILRSETVLSRERSGLLQGTMQESRTSVNMEAKKRAEKLDRQIKRLSGTNLYETRVTAVAWGSDIETADMDARRMALALVGALRPDSDQEEFRVEHTTKRKDVLRLMAGLPVGASSVLTAGEVTNYCMLPRRDLGISVTRREKFASGMKNERESVDREQEQQPLFTTCVPSNVHWLKRRPVLYFGHPLDSAGNVLSRSYVTTEINHLNMHVIVAGITQSGKSTTLQSIFGQAFTLGVNPIQFNPSKSFETRRMMNLFDDVRYYTCGRDDIANLLFNLWTPPANVPLSKWVDRVVQAWTLWLPNDEIMSMHFEKIVYTMYERCGWVLKTNKVGRPILISDLIKALEEEETQLKYGDEVSSNVFGALVERIRSILRKHTIIGMFNTTSGITVSELLAHPTIIDMDALSHNEKILLMGILTAAI